MADRPGGRTALRWGLEPASYQVTARPVGLSSTVANPDRQIESQALSQSQRESGPGRDRRAHHRSHEATLGDLVVHADSVGNSSIGTSSCVKSRT